MDALSRSLVEGIADALVVVDEARTVVEWNAAMVRTTGVPRGRALGQPAEKAAPLLRDPEVAARLGEALAGDTPGPVELPHADPAGGRPVWLEARCAPLRDAAGRVAGALVFLTDITERHARALFLRAIETIGNSLTASLDLDEVLDTIVAKAMEVMGAESALVVAWDGGATEFTVLRAGGRLSQRYAEIGAIPVGGGPIARAIREARPVATRNILSDPDVWLPPERRAQVAAEGYTAAAAAPLASKGGVHGALVVHYWQERTFGEEELAALKLLAEQASLALDNARLYTEATHRAARLRELAGVQQLVAGSLELDEVLGVISEAAAQITGARFASFWLADEERRALTFTSGSVPEMVEEFTPRVVDYETGGVGWVARHRAPLIVDDLLADPRLLNRMWMERWGLRAFAAYPVMGGSELLAVMALGHAEPLRFSPDTQDLIGLFIGQAAIAIQNARLYGEAQRRRDVAEVLARLGRELTASLEVERIAELLANGLVELVRARSAAVFRYDPDDGTLREIAAAGVDREAVRGLVLPPGVGLTGRAVAERRTITTPDLLEDPALTLPPAVRERLAAHQSRGAVAVPLLTPERVIGALALGVEAGREFSPEELQGLEALADHAALAFENARLYAAARDSLVRLRDAQAQLVQAAKMGALGQLVSGVAHELNNPLSVIIGYGQLLLSREIPAPLQRPVELMVAQADRMAKIVKNLLFFSRQRPPERVAVDLTQVLEQALVLRLNQLNLSGIAVEREYTPELPPIAGDPHQLEQVLLNLLLNAEQAILDAGRGGRIALRTRVSGAGRGVTVEIEDDGPGIPAEVVAHIFEPFFTTKSVGSGTGLGLSVSYGIVQEHGGLLAVASEPGRTVFRLELPALREESLGAVEPAPEPRAIAGNGRAALVVEDEESVRDLVVTLLGQTGWRVDVAGGGRAGLEQVRQRRYDLVVSDLRMAEGGGEEFYRTAVVQDPALRRRFVFITGDTANREAWRFLGDAHVPVIEKPFQPALFLDAVRRVTTALPPAA